MTGFFVFFTAKKVFRQTGNHGGHERSHGPGHGHDGVQEGVGYGDGVHPGFGRGIIKAVTAPLLAPCFLNETAAGSTPQEHKGIGMPRKAALKTELARPCPKCRATAAGLKKTLSKPATSSPNIT